MKAAWTTLDAVRRPVVPAAGGQPVPCQYDAGVAA